MNPFLRFCAGMAMTALLGACSESEPYTPDADGGMETVVEEDATMTEVEAPPSPSAPPTSFGAMRAAEAAYRASAAYAVYEPEATDPSAPPIITVAEFDQLQPGMTYVAALNIIGEQGELLNETVSGGSGARMSRYRWVNGDGSYADITFTNLSLTEKTQQRLP